MDIKDSVGKGDPYKVFLEQMRYADEQISKRILGGTMISDDGSSRSQSEVHERTLNGILGEQDRKRLEFAVNDQLLPMFVAAGMLSEGDEFVFDRNKEIDILTHWNIVSGMLNHYDVDQEWVSNKFNVPIIGRRAAPDYSNFNLPPQPRANYGGQSILPVYPAGCCPGRGAAATGETPSGLDKLQAEILRLLWEGKEALPAALEKAAEVGRHYAAGLFEGWGGRRMEIAYDAPDHRALALMEQNLFTFSSLREKASIFELNNLLIDKEGKRLREFKDFREAARPHLERLNVRNLKTEYDFAVAAGQMSSRYEQFMSEKDTLTRYVQYVTVADDRVRNAHQALHMRVFDLNDPEARTLWPPNGWNCRCDMQQYMGKPPVGLLTSGNTGKGLMGWTPEQEKHFGFNRAEAGKVFKETQYYIQDNGLADEWAAMSYDKYGLKKWADLRGDYAPANLDENLTPEDARKQFKPEEGKDYMGFVDYLGRTLSLAKDAFDKHTSGKYIREREQRHQLFEKLPDVLAAPDEVYMAPHGKKTYQLRFVKHYADMSIVAPATIDSRGYQIETWYKMIPAEDARQRAGLLIHTKKP